MSRPRLLVCGFGPFPQSPDNPSGLTIRRLEGDGWTPEGADALYAVLPTQWSQAPQTALEAANRGNAAAILLVGVAVHAAAFRVETTARNRASIVHADAAGALWPRPSIDKDGPESLSVTAPTEAMRAAIDERGLPVHLSDDAGDYLCNFVLYRLLAEAGVRPVGFVHVPQIGEAFSADAIARAVRAAAEAFSARLA